MSDEGINMDLATFKAQYANSGGAVECVTTQVFASHSLTNHFGSRNQLNFFTSHEDNAADHIFVYFSDDKSVGIKTMRKCVSTTLSLYILLTARTFVFIA